MDTDRELAKLWAGHVKKIAAIAGSGLFKAA